MFLLFPLSASVLLFLLYSEIFPNTLFTTEDDERPLTMRRGEDTAGGPGGGVGRVAVLVDVMLLSLISRRRARSITTPFLSPPSPRVYPKSNRSPAIQQAALPSARF